MNEEISKHIALLHAWQEFALHPCWQEWKMALAVDAEIADDMLHTGVGPLDIVGFNVARAQYAAVMGFINYPEMRAEQLKAEIADLEKRSFGKESD